VTILVLFIYIYNLNKFLYIVVNYGILMMYFVFDKIFNPLGILTQVSKLPMGIFYGKKINHISD